MNAPKQRTTTAVTIQPSFDGWELEDLLGSIKKWTSRIIREWLNDHPNLMPPSTMERDKHRLWQFESYDRIIRDAEELSAFRRYIARNGAVAKLRTNESHYGAAGWLDEFAAVS